MNPSPRELVHPKANTLVYTVYVHTDHTSFDFSVNLFPRYEKSSRYRYHKILITHESENSHSLLLCGDEIFYKLPDFFSVYYLTLAPPFYHKKKLYSHYRLPKYYLCSVKSIFDKFSEKYCKKKAFPKPIHSNLPSLPLTPIPITLSPRFEYCNYPFRKKNHVLGENSRILLYEPQSNRYNCFTRGTYIQSRAFGGLDVSAGLLRIIKIGVHCLFSIIEICSKISATQNLV